MTSLALPARAACATLAPVGSTPITSLLHDPLAVPVAYLAVATVGAAFAFNAHRPLARDGGLSISVFFAGWLTAELPLHHVAWQLAATAVFARAGALVAWPGWLGLGVAVATWAALLHLFVRARDARDIVERALVEALGAAYRSRLVPEQLLRLDRPLTPVELLLPFRPRRREVECIRNVRYGEYGRRNTLDIYRHRDAPTGCPVLVQVHGGAWIIGDKNRQGLPLIHHLAAQGWVCVAINYRLSPRSTFPDHVVDVKRAIAWVKANIASFGGDPGFVAITGGSAGGHLASLAALTGDRELQPGFEAADTSVAACVSFYGVYDFTNRSGLGRPSLRPFLERLVVKRPFAEARDTYDRASPMSRVHRDAPPFLVLHGTNDTLVPVAEARLFVDLLRRASSAPVAYVELPQTQHAFEVFTSLRAAHVVRGVARFLACVHADYARAARESSGRRADSHASTASTASTAIAHEEVSARFALGEQGASR